MPKYSFSDIKEKLNLMIAEGIEPELSLFLHDKEYMLIGYKDRCSFQRCGVHDGSGEFFYNTLEELYNSTTVDDIMLKRDWSDISSFECVDYEWYHDEEF